MALNFSIETSLCVAYTYTSIYHYLLGVRVFTKFSETSNTTFFCPYFCYDMSALDLGPSHFENEDTYETIRRL